MKRTAKLLLWLALLTALLLPGMASASQVGNGIKLNQVQQNGAVITMYVNLSDGTGMPLNTADVDASHFNVQVDDTSYPVDSAQAFDPKTMGIHYVFCVDVSGSLNDDMMQAIHEGLCTFIDELSPRDTVSLLTFGNDIRQITVQNSNHDELKELINNEILITNEDTALYKAVCDGVELARVSGGRSTVIVITDGANDVAKLDPSIQAYTKESIFSQVTRAQVPLYGIGLTDKNVDSQSLIELAEATGGNQFLRPAAEINESLEQIRNIMRSAVVLQATLVNTDGKTGFTTASKFIVGYDSPGGVLLSNELEQAINWQKVPAPVYTPEPSAVPELSLDLDSVEIEYREGGDVTLTGVIEVQQGSVDMNALTISVNGELWRTEMKPNGKNYIFSATGQISGDEQTLEVSAGIQGTSITSRYQMVTVRTPAPTASATPAPMLTLQLDEMQQPLLRTGDVLQLTGVVTATGAIDASQLAMYVNDRPCEASFTDLGNNQYEFSANYQMGYEVQLNISVALGDSGIVTRSQRLFLTAPTETPAPQLSLTLNDFPQDPMLLPGETLTISGVIEASGTIDPTALTLIINQFPYELTTHDLGNNQYEFSVDYVMGYDTQLNINVQMDSMGILSRSERLYLATPSPTPAPSLSLTLDQASLDYTEGEPITIAGSVDVTGTVAAEDIAIYVRSVRWTDVVLEQRDDGSYHFTASNTLMGGDMSQLDVKAKLLSDANISSNTATLALVLPTPVITASPTPKAPSTVPPTPTPSPTPVPTASPSPEPTEQAGIQAIISSLNNSGRMPLAIAALALIVIVIIVLIVWLVLRRKKRKPEVSPVNGASDPSREGQGGIGTVRPGDSGGATVEGRGPSGEQDWVDPNTNSYGSSGRSSESGKGGTIVIGQGSDLDSGSTVRIGENYNLDDADIGSQGGEEAGGTQRMDIVPHVEITLEESFRKTQRGMRTLEMKQGEELVFGRKDKGVADVLFEDAGVSTRHLKLYFDGDHVFVEDCNSTNGTRVNGEKQKLASGESRQLQDGDTLRLGETTLTLHISPVEEE